jgi:hypothetical protein
MSTQLCKHTRVHSGTGSHEEFEIAIGGYNIESLHREGHTAALPPYADAIIHVL